MSEAPSLEALCALLGGTAPALGLLGGLVVGIVTFARFVGRSRPPGRSLSNRLALVVLLPAVLVAASMATLGLLAELDRRTQEVESAKRRALTSRNRELRARVDQAVTLLEGLGRHELAPRERLERHARRQLERITYDHGDGYLFILTEDRDLASRGLEGAGDRPATRVTTGLRTATELAVRQAARDPEGGMVTYAWPVPSTGRLGRKLAIVREVPGWDWILGAGVYLDDVEREYRAGLAAAQRDTRTQLAHLAAAGLALTALVVAFGHRASRQLGREVVAFGGRVEEALNEREPLEARPDGYFELERLTKPLNEVFEVFWARSRALETANEELRRSNERLVEANARERELARTAESSSRAKSDFISTMSHELRTPIHGVLGMLDCLARSDVGAEGAEQIGMARGSALSLLRTVNEILEFTGIEPQPSCAELEVRPIVRELVDGLRPAATHRSIALELDVAPEVPVRAVGPGPQVRRALELLLENAIRFTEAGGVELTISPDSRGLLFSVSDTGVGIPSDQRDSVFEPFHQMESAANRRFGGTGLGLAIARRLAESMGADIEVESRVGVGSRFTLAVPLGRAAPEGPTLAEASVEARPGPDAAPETSDLCVLVVDDNRVNRMVAASMVRRLGYEVTVAEGGREALQLLETHRFGMVLMDCHMPEVDGFAASRALRGGEAGPDNRCVPVVALTAGDSSVTEANCYAAGMNDYLAKPVSAEMLRSALRRWTGRELAASACAKQPESSRV